MNSAVLAKLPRSLDDSALGKPLKTNLSCAVVVCSRGRPEKLDQCLGAISQLRYSEFDVLVVDNAPEDARAKEVALRWGARYCIEPTPGLSWARNRGARECDAEIVAYLDDDCECLPEWLDALTLEFADPKVMAVTGMILPLLSDSDATNCVQTAGKRRAVDRDVFAWFEMSNFGGLGTGGNMAFRRRAFEVWPGFDVRLGRGAFMWGGEEHEAFFSLIERGYRVVYTPRAIVRHPCLHTLEELRTRAIKDYEAQSAYVALLLVERPRYWRATVKYVLEALRQVDRQWRYSMGGAIQPRRKLVSTWRRVMAYVCGPVLYLRACLGRPARYRG